MGVWRQRCGATRQQSFWQRRQIQLIQRHSNSWRGLPETTSVAMSALPVAILETGGRARVSRLALLVVCILAGVAAGVAAGVVGSYATGSHQWYLAGPQVVPTAWLVAANPEQFSQRKQ